MHELMDELYELCETVEKDIQKTNEKLRMAGGDMSGADLEYVDKLTHTLKSIKCVMAMLEDEDGYSERSREGSSRRSSYRGSSRRGSSREGSSREGRQGSSREGSYAQRRNRMGQYSREDDFRELLEEAMQNAPSDQIRRQLEQMMM